MRAVQIQSTGGPEVLELSEVDDPAPGPGQVLVRVEAAGLNFIDTYQRSGAYPLDLPAVLGLEGAGVVERAAGGAPDPQPGDRVAWNGSLGSYAELVAVDADDLVEVPADVELPTAAAVMLQGVTAHYLATSTFPLGEEHVALVHAGAGGVGQLLVQIAKLRGARVLTTVSTSEKEAIARACGADEVIRYTEVDFADAVRELTGGAGVDVVYESVGKATFDASLGLLRPRGMLVLFGQSSGAVPPVDPQRLNRGGSLFLTRPTLKDYTATPEELRARCRDLFGWISSGDLEVRIDTTFPLDRAAQAHAYIEGRRTKGKVLLVP
jgi:NADPH:quinone reductase